MSSVLAPIHGTPFVGGNPPGDLQVDSSGLQSVIKVNFGSGSTPTVNDDSDSGYSIGSRWWTTSGEFYYCDDATVGAAVWTLVNASGITIDSTAITGGGANRILFENASNQVSSDANLTWDGTLGIMQDSTSVPSLRFGTNVNNTEKRGYINARQYASGTETEGFHVLGIYSDVSMNWIYIGGGGTSYNASTKISFYTGGTVSTRTGTERIQITSDGLVGINKSSSIGAQLHVVAGSATTVGSIIEAAAAQTANLLEINSSGGSGGDKFRITSAGEIVIPSTATFNFSTGPWFGVVSNNLNFALGGLYEVSIRPGANGHGVSINSNGKFGITSSTSSSGTIDTALSRNAAGVLSLNDGNGATDATPTAATLIGQSGLGTDIAGAALNLAGGQGTGAGAGGVLNLQASRAGTTGSSLNSLVTLATLGNASENLSLTADAATTIPFKINAAAAQTANLLEINSSGGSGGDLFKIQSDGDIYPAKDIYLVSGKTITTASGYSFKMTSAGSGGGGFTVYSSSAGSELIGNPGVPLNIRITTPSVDTSPKAVSITAGTAMDSATVNIVGGNVNVTGGSGASGSAGAANGGDIVLTGGTGYGTGVDGFVDFATDHADTSSQDPTTDAPADWLTIKHAGTEYVIPLYTKA